MTKGYLLVTGATGLVGANMCVAATRAGYRVRGLVRSLEGTGPLTDAGVELALGDVTDAASVLAAAQGVEDIVHSAAVMGGTWGTSDPKAHWAVNYQGVINVLDAARATGVRRCMLYSSLGVLDWRYTATNNAPLLPIGATDTPYSRAKRAAMYASLHRASVDQDIVSVLPGQIYGPSPLVDRAVVPTSFTGTLLLALRGELERYVPIPATWTFVDEVVNVGLAALERGGNGERYLAVGREEDTCTLADFCNLGCEIAGVSHRVANIDLTSGGAEIGAMRTYAERKVPKPYVDPSGTEAALGLAPMLLRSGLQETVAWLGDVGKIQAR